ncbi:MAG: BTAD domain-containing putative transcriptional regulator [Chloroflexota bacterium]|nr:BTAD domain-containing putative transcriptional regulator [Chloroflexota bacterium]
MLPLSGRRSPGTIDRPRLLDLLQGVLSHRITLICAPSGYGKTTLAAQFVGQVSAAVIWHTVDAAQRDVYNLHLRATAAIGTTFLRLAAPQPTAGMAPARLVKDLTRFLHAQSGSIVYVLDDLQHLVGAAGAEQWLSGLAAGLPAHVHLLITSQQVPDVITASMIARREVLGIGMEKLRFTTDETARLAESLIGSAAFEPDLARVTAHLEGWAAGLSLALQPVPTTFLDPALFAVGTPEMLFDSLARNLFDAQNPVVQDFLLLASTLPTITPELLIGALALPGALPHLQEAIDRGLFIAPVTGGMALHGLFRAFLQREFKGRHPARWREAHGVVAAWHEARLAVDEAVAHYLEGDYHEQALRLIDLYARAHYDQARYETLFRWDAALKAQRLTSGWLLYLCAAVLIDRLQYSEARANLSESEDAFSAAGNAEGLARVRLMQAHIALLEGNHNAAFTIAESVLHADDTPPALQGAALRVRGLTHLRAGSAPDAAADFEAARPLYETYCDRLALTKLLGDLDEAYRQVGRVHDAAECLRQIVAIRRDSPGQVGLATALNQFGLFMYLRGELSIAYELLDEGIRLALRTGDRRTEAYMCWSMGDLLRDRGAYNDAIHQYNRALELAGVDEPYVRCGVLIGLSLLMRWRGSPDDSHSLLIEAGALAGAHGFRLESATIVVARCALMPLSMSSDAALIELAGALDRLHTLNAGMAVAHALAIVALLHVMRGDLSAADTAFAALLARIKENPLIQTAIAEIAFTPMLYDALARLDKRYEPLQKAARALRKSSAQPSNIIPLDNGSSAPTMSLKVQTLGKEIFERDGSLILPNEWKAHAARVLFVHLLVEGAQRREDLCLRFFPTTDDSKKAQNLFHTTVRRARDVIGANVIVFQDDVYMINPEVSIWCDALVFERAVRDAKGKPRYDPLTSELWRRALDIYQGDFLPDCYMDWALDYRRHLSEVYLDALITMGEIAMARADLVEALRLFLQALKVDPLREHIYRQVFLIYAGMGLRHEIVAQWEKMKRLFLGELGVLPSPETVQLVKNLLA